MFMNCIDWYSFVCMFLPARDVWNAFMNILTDAIDKFFATFICNQNYAVKC